MKKIKSYNSLFYAEVLRCVKLLKMYPLDTINNIISFVIVSCVIIFGINKLGNIEQLFGMIVFPIIMALISGPSASIRSDIEIGVFEQVYTSQYSILSVGIIRSIVNALFSLFSSIIIGIIIYVFYYELYISILGLTFSFLYITALSLAIGTLLAGITIRFRKTETILNFVNILIMIELLIPISSINTNTIYAITTLVPFSGIIIFLQNIFTNTNINNQNTIILLSLFNLIIWGVLGVWIYNNMLRASKLNGSLGKY